MEIGQIVTKGDTAQQQAKGTGHTQLVPKKGWTGSGLGNVRHTHTVY